VTAKSINPITGGNRQGIGVQPDIEVPRDRALEYVLQQMCGAKQIPVP